MTIKGIKFCVISFIISQALTSGKGALAGELTLVRNATMRLSYGGKILLLDPMLSEKGAMPPFAGKARNPTVGLPMTEQNILRDIDAVVVSHRHPDHYDAVAAKSLNKSIPLFCQPWEEGEFRRDGFSDVKPIEDTVVVDGITISRIEGAHGPSASVEELIKKSGSKEGWRTSSFLFSAKGEPKIFWSGDTIFTKNIEDAIKRHRPEILIVHIGGAQLPGMPPIIMGHSDLKRISQAAPEAKIVALHLDALDHCSTSREMVKREGQRLNLDSTRLVVPKDGETINLLRMP